MNNSIDIVLLTSSKYLVKDPTDPLVQNILLEDQLLSDALHSAGLTAVRKSWDDPDMDWGTTTYVLIRTPWDYFDRYSEFSNWFKNTSEHTPFINSKKLIDWNIDKHYLFDLEKKGIRIPKTLVIEPREEVTLASRAEKAKMELGFSSNDFVLKPCIAGGAWHTYKFHLSEVNQYEEIFEKLIQQESLLLQEFQKNIVEKGEISMMIIDGQFTHAVLKIAKPGDFRVQDDWGGTVHNYRPSKEEIQFAEEVVRAAPEFPIYARVDIFEDNDGHLALAELEIFEPELWFREYPDSARLLASSIKKRCFP